MEDPRRLANDDPRTARDDDEAAELQRRAEEAMERMLLAQEDEDEEADGNDDDDDDAIGAANPADGIGGDARLGFADEGGGEVGNGDAAAFWQDDLLNNDNINDINNINDVEFGDGPPRKNPFTYVRLSFWSAIALVYYAYRSRQQWYLALVFLSSSKYAYVILGNAFVALLIWVFRITTNFFLNGLRLNEAEGLTDFFRWHITETCLALTIFRSELNVKTFVLFLFLVLAKCLHYIVDARESHLRMTEEIVVVNPSTGWIGVRLPHVKLFALICFLQILDVFAVILCGRDITANGPTVSILFAFESAIMLTSVISNCLLWYLHLLDGIFHYLHESSEPGALFHRWIYPWKDHKATVVFAVELQAQAAKFLFYLTFFAIVMTYYGLPINLIREVYVSFLALKQRVVAFNKYRQLMSSMNRFKSPTGEELEEEHICIICRDEMTVETAKRLPGCGHIFHKSCLREWLVQQQTCPTCRGDISAMEARQRAQDDMDARVQERREEERDEDQGGRDADDETNDEDREPTAARIGEREEPSNAADGNAQDGSPRVGDDPDETHPSRSVTRTAAIEEEDRNGAKRVVATATDVASSADAERPAFPAFYRAVRGTGVSVYRDGTAASSLDVIRTVPAGVVFVGLEMRYRKCNGANRIMIKLPDGWVSEDTVERIVAVPMTLTSTTS